jgi:hypothetical protein
MRKTLVAAIVMLAVALAAAGCAPASNNAANTSTAPPSTTPTTSAPTSPTAGAAVYTALLKPVNGSKVHGLATVIVNGSRVRVMIAAAGMVPNQSHAQHIHGIESSSSTCPPTVAGTITPESAAEAYYGPVLVPLEPFPTASASGTITYSTAVSVPSTTFPLTGKAIVLHGLMVNGTYDPSVPVACGELVAQRGGATGTETSPGAGSTGATGSTGTSGGAGGTGNSTGNETGNSTGNSTDNSTGNTTGNSSP